MDPWKLPPIVGEVTDNKASVLFQLYDLSSQVTYQVNNKIHKVIVEPSGPTNIIINLKKSGTFVVKWIIDNHLYYQHQIVNEPISRLIFVSCDFVEADTPNSLWTKMLDDIVGKTVIVHLGDQIYGDPVFNQCKKLLTNLTDFNTQQQCFDLYGDRCCETWKPHCQVLSNTSNYYVWDDHEIYNDIQLNTMHDPTTKKIINVAVNAYNQYQQSFHIDHDFMINDYCWYKYINNNTILLTIERTSRDVELEEIFEAIMNFDVDHLILCFTSAPIPTPHGFNGNLYKSLKGLGKFWPEDQLILLYQWLFKWMTMKKKVVVVGGDVHFGVYGHMTKDDLSIPVIIASPITNQPYLDRQLAAKGMRGTHLLADMTFTTTISKARRCYATLDMDTMAIRMVYSQDKYPKNKIKYIKKLLQF